MKKFLALLLALACLFTAAAAFAEGPWPEREFEGPEAKLRGLNDAEQRHQAWYGPGNKAYAQAGAYKPKKATSVRVLLRENGYTLVDMEYQTAGKRCVYFKNSNVKGADVPEESLKGYAAAVAQATVPRQGPGEDYEIIVQKKKSPYADWAFDDLVDKFGGSIEIWEALQDRQYSVALEEGTDLTVFFETRGWVFAEFTCSLGKVRAWLPADRVEAR